jgi:hypothetical protein
LRDRLLHAFQRSRIDILDSVVVKPPRSPISAFMSAMIAHCLDD